MRKILLIFILLLIFACEKQERQQEIVCEKPYIRHALSCCLDVNNNSICDNDEEKTEELDSKPVQTIEPALTQNKTEKKQQTNFDFESVKKSLVLIELVHRGETIDGGMGFFVSKEGHLISSWRYLNEWPKLLNSYNSFINVTYHNGKTFHDVEIISHNEYYDLTLLKIKNIDLEFKPIEFADSYKVGDSTYIIGFPYIKGFSLTKGILSSLRQYKGNEFLQTDAAYSITSGVPMFNERGQLIGMVSSKYVFGEGLNFAKGFKMVQSFYNSSEIMRCTELNYEGNLWKTNCPLLVKRENNNVSLIGNPSIFYADKEFKEFTIKLSNKDNTSHTLCFEVFSIGDMVKIKKDVLSQKAVLFPQDSGKDFTIKVGLKGDEDLLSYFEVDVKECGEEYSYFEFSFGKENKE